ncbi:MAG: hypothetical protein JO108_17840 [Acidobacteriaceae bacterium]|nr:hypothetical protein [Acidobacteriaceae bacterium]
MDAGIITDDNLDGDVEYNWSRTEKSYDLSHIPTGYSSPCARTPLRIIYRSTELTSPRFSWDALGKGYKLGVQAISCATS